MSLILNIDTSTENASICLAQNDQCLHQLSNDRQKDHASWLHTGIGLLLKESGKEISDIKAVGVTTGPGSYTGLRVGMSTAKGLCYALNIPFITVNTLEAMASAAVQESADLICPMIDARRMEVYTALYDRSLQIVLSPCAVELDNYTFLDYLNENRILFLGNRQNKLEKFLMHENAYFKNIIFNVLHVSPLIYLKYCNSDFSDLAYTQPLYLKEHPAIVSK